MSRKTEAFVAALVLKMMMLSLRRPRGKRLVPDEDYPQIKRLARKSGVSDSTVVRVMRDLVENGFIRRRRKGRYQPGVRIISLARGLSVVEPAAPGSIWGHETREEGQKEHVEDVEDVDVKTPMPVDKDRLAGWARLCRYISERLGHGYYSAADRAYGVLLFVVGDPGRRASVIAKGLGASPSSVSGALRRLIDLGLVRRDGHQYYVDEDGLLQFFKDFEDFARKEEEWQQELASLFRNGSEVTGNLQGTNGKD